MTISMCPLVNLREHTMIHILELTGGLLISMIPAWLNLDYFSAIKISSTVLTLTASLYLFSLKNKTGSTLFLGFGFVGATIFNLSMFIEFGGDYYWQPDSVKTIIMPMLQNIGPSIALLSLLLFTFSFPIPLKKERKLKIVFLAIFLGLNALSLTSAVIVFFIFERQSRTLHLTPLYLRVLFLIIGVQFLLIILLMFRKVVVLGRNKLRESIKSVFNPNNPRARLARTIAAILAMPALITFIYLFSTSDIISPIMGTYIVWFGFLLFYSVFIIAYLNNTSERTTLQVRLVGIAMVCTLGILCVAAIISGRQFEHDYKDDNWPDNESALQLSRNVNDGYRAEAVPFRSIRPLGRKLDITYGEFIDLDLPFIFPFYADGYTKIRVLSGPLVFLGTELREHGWGGYHPNPSIAPLIMGLEPERGNGIYYEASDDQVIITWYRIPERYSDVPNTIQLIILKNGTIRFSYGAIIQEPQFRPASLQMDVDTSASVFARDTSGESFPHQSWLIGVHPGTRGAGLMPIRFRHDLPYTTSGTDALFEAFDIRFFQYIHERTVPLVLLVVTTSVFILLVFPAIFRRSVTRPLLNLSSGMQRADAGEQDVYVQPHVNDELGFITESFNKMIRSIRNAEEKPECSIIRSCAPTNSPALGLWSQALRTKSTIPIRQYSAASRF